MRRSTAPPRPETPLGLYLHIPFCRKRCKFCYFRVYTDKNARDVETYIDAPGARRSSCTGQCRLVGGGAVQFVYFGGGTPSYLSATQLRGLFERVQRAFPWDRAEEVTFECEPGTLQQHKLETLEAWASPGSAWASRTSTISILEENGRAHLSAEIFRAYGWARELGFDQINIDLIAGMVGETWDNWRACVQKTIELAPDSVTVYQMELPFNTVFSQRAAADRPGGGRSGAGGRLADEAGVGRLRVRGIEPGRLRRVKRLHDGARSGTHEVRLSRQPVARRGHVRHRRRVVRPRRRRAHAERRQLGPLQGAGPEGRIAARPGAAGQRRTSSCAAR